MPSRPSNLTKKPHSIHHSKNNYLDIQALKELPDSFVWTPQEDPSSIDDELGVQAQKSVPIINLEDQNAQHYIGLACKSWGVFQVTNHGISKILLDKIQAASKSLFNLPAHQKLKVARSSNGITGYGPARISSFFSKRMWSEGFTILGPPLDHARQLWPNDYKKFCDTIEEYEKQMNQLANKLMKLILASLGIPKQDILKWADYLFKGSNGAIQLNHYPICPDPNRAMGLAAHTDSTLLTILHQNRTTGLQVFKDHVGWVTVPPLSNGLVINIGDLLQIMSNGQYPSVYHRARVNRAQDRLSVAYLYGPSSGVRIQPLPMLVDVTCPPLYKGVTWSEYLAIKGKHFNKALSLVRLNHNTQTIIMGDEPRSMDLDKTILAEFA